MGSEIRQFARLALEGHERAAAALEPGGLTVHALEDISRFPTPVIYERNADSAGKFGNCVLELILFFGNISIFGRAVERIKTNTGSRRAPIGLDNTKMVADELLKISQIGESLISQIDNPRYFDDADGRYRKQLRVARDAWNLRLKRMGDATPVRRAEPTGTPGARPKTDQP
jgi:hypothetical protein